VLAPRISELEEYLDPVAVASKENADVDGGTAEDFQEEPDSEWDLCRKQHSK
jgi:hypothetical protein